MPVIIVEGSPLDQAQKEELIKTLSQEASRIMRVPVKKYIILIKENAPDNIGVGDITLNKLHSM